MDLSRSDGASHRFGDFMQDVLLAVVLQRMHGIESEPIEVKLLEPVESIGNDQLAHGFGKLLHDLNEATAALRKDKTAQEALGPVIYKYLMEAQQAHWRDYSMHVHPWEVEHYLAYY